MKYPIYKIKTFDKIEQLGTKEKFWFYTQEDKISRLCKFGRLGTGENWAEKVANEIAEILTIPCAKYDFALYRDRECVISQNFVPEYCRLIHGNELLVNLINEHYPKDQKYKVTEYELKSVEKVFKALRGIINLPINYEKHASVQFAMDMFVSYLMLDCLISNQDRHHENWGIIFDSKSQKYHLTPTYDHASSLGCRISDEERKKRLTTTDKRYSVSAFVQRAKTPIYNSKFKQLNTLDAFLKIAKKNKKAAIYWIEKLSNITDDSLKKIFDRVPVHLISCAATEFAVSIIKENKSRLMKAKEKLT
nr:HipA domain-containing protein [uncultured Desulfobacter sp.]